MELAPNLLYSGGS